MFTDITSFEKHLESSSGPILSFCPNWVNYRFKNIFFEGISHPVFYGDLVYKLRRVKGTVIFVLSGP